MDHNYTTTYQIAPNSQFILPYQPDDMCRVETKSGQIYCVGENYWYCYLIRSVKTNRTYVGFTNNMSRRLRQHNGEIKGGAKATRRGRPWELIVYVQGFLTNNEALSFEWYMHHPKSIYNSRLNTSGLTWKRGYSLKYKLEHMRLLLKYGVWRKKYETKDNIMTIFWHIDQRWPDEKIGDLVRQYHISK